MTTFIIIVLIFFIVGAASSKKSKPQKQRNSYQPKPSREPVRHNTSTRSLPKVTISNSKPMDNSIIDITGKSYNLPNTSSSNSNVPYWGHQYVYSYSEINTATNEQRTFYKTFKANFLSEIFTDLHGNNNYAFILLFDLLNEFDNHRNVTLLEKQLKALGDNYPKTKSYCISFLIKKLEEKGENSAVERIRQQESYYNNYYDYDYWKLGTQYKAKLNLNNEDVTLLNKLWNPSNNFFNIEFCGLEIIKLYLAVIKKLDEKYQKESSSLKDELLKVADIIARKHYSYRKGSGNYTYSLETIVNELNSHIFKYCENAVRENYGHKRKLNVEMPYASADVKAEYDDKLVVRLKKIIEVYTPTISQLDHKTELELNTQNTTRWKIKFDQLTDKYNNDSKKFINDIISLGNSNKNNPSIENIFYEASKFIANHDKEASLTLYIYYLHYDLKSVKFDNKQLNKTIQKSLFKTNEQLHDFQIIISQFVQDKDLEKALKAVPSVYAIKRKKIQLDRNTIQEVHDKHSGTVELLNEYLKDEYEDESNTFKTQEINNEEVVMEIISKLDNNDVSPFDNSLNFTKIQHEVLEIFSKANLSILQTDLEMFAKSKGMFKNQIIESINETCYEILDDVLIEEDEEFYTINENYYNQILAK
ncbi:tellurite resistance TerB C-terminal domain-containing protein [Flavobacterium sp. AG291]|uniref:tellurite resistance TerB C-terminal domain-containing protein n=1 Tax=Flavobacterium sp. AG291 TaxID=2184000 RepID=UPI000E2CB99D|nr:tellurite resistance TerB C-terminal domain-containing protein [Flavobacterium sp. AG291]RDI14428.1 TerB-like protein [Flavobacterium sp. AG291]